ncbi:MAG: AAA family ATPase, partial [Anaerolineales bacterium]|nr:AAA family ATPase [Anaerolineales bacterium]
MTQLTLSLLGTFAAAWQGQPVTGFQTDKVRALLAYLAVEGKRPLRRETLATLLWPDWADDKAKRNLRQNLHRLKQVLDALDLDLSQNLLHITRQTVQVNREWLVLDVVEFQAALTAVETHPHRHLHICPVCLDSLTRAADLVRGDLLEGFSLPDAPLFDEWLTIQRERLHYQSLQALHTLAAAHAQRGDHEQAYIYAARQVALEPWREEAHRQMMAALARQGRRSEALTQYETCRRLLDEELGVAPTAETVTLYTQIVNETLDVEAETAVTLHHFPAQFTRFVGRSEEITAVTQHLLDPDCRLLTLIGPGGMGKTRLSLQAVENTVETETRAAYELFPDGGYFVPLADAFTRDQLITAIAETLGITLQAAGDAEQQLLNYVSGKKLLLALDNFEQLVETAVFITHLLQTAPHVRCLITSREPLNSQAEQQMRLTGLPYPAAAETDLSPQRYPAMMLFIQTAQHVQPTFQPHATDWQAIARICQLTHGTPLALEIAAAWVRLMDCATIAQQISRSLDFLETSWRDMPERHRSMRAVFQQSWEFLSAAEQR